VVAVPSVQVAMWLRRVWPTLSLPSMAPGVAERDVPVRIARTRGQGTLRVPRDAGPRAVPRQAG